MSTSPVLQRSPTERELVAHKIALRLDGPIGTLGVVALGLWLLEPIISQQALLRNIVELVWVVIALAFLGEFIIRTIVAPSTWLFMRQHWWEVVLVALPFLRFLRVLRAGRVARGLTSVVHSSQHAGTKLRNRLTLLLVVTAVVACAAGRMLWEFGGYRYSYVEALHDAAMSTVTGTELGSRYAFAQFLEIILGIYSAVIIATIAGSLGAFFVEAKTDSAPPVGPWWESSVEPRVEPHVSE